MFNTDLYSLENGQVPLNYLLHSSLFKKRKKKNHTSLSNSRYKWWSLKLKYESLSHIIACGWKILKSLNNRSREDTRKNHLLVYLTGTEAQLFHLDQTPGAAETINGRRYRITKVDPVCFVIMVHSTKNGYF